MAEYNNNKHIGSFRVQPTDAQIETLRRYDPALGSPGHEAMHDRPASYFTVEVSPGVQVPSGGSASTLAWKAPFPCTLLQVSMGAAVHGAGLSALTGDVQVSRTGVPGYTSVLDAVEDLFAPGAGETAEVAPEDGSEVLEYGDQVKIDFAATGGTADGAAAYLTLKKL